MKGILLCQKRKAIQVIEIQKMDNLLQKMRQKEDLAPHKRRVSQIRGKVTPEEAEEVVTRRNKLIFFNSQITSIGLLLEWK